MHRHTRVAAQAVRWRLDRASDCHATAAHSPPKHSDAGSSDHAVNITAMSMITELVVRPELWDRAIQVDYIERELPQPTSLEVLNTTHPHLQTPIE